MQDMLARERIIAALAIYAIQLDKNAKAMKNKQFAAAAEVFTTDAKNIRDLMDQIMTQQILINKAIDPQARAAKG